MVRGQKGQALPIVLVLLVLGGLLIVPTLSYASTSLKGYQVTETKTRGIYASDSGVEDALWQLKSTGTISPSSYALSENVNLMDVTVETEKTGKYVLYFGEFIEENKPQGDWLTVDGELDTTPIWDDEIEDYKYKYTITVTWHSGGETIHLAEVGGRLPLGCSYSNGSAALFDDNICTEDEPYLERQIDDNDAQMLNWKLTAPYPGVYLQEGETRTQQFYVTGNQEDENDYGWAVAHVAHGTYYSEIGGCLYIITATAKLNGECKAQAVTYVIYDGENPHIITYQIN